MATPAQPPAGHGQPVKQADNLLPDFDSAYATIFDGVHQQVFFQKLASFGRFPQSQEQAVVMLKLAGDLRSAEEELVAKQAADAADPYLAALNDLHGLAGGGGQPATATAELHAMKAAADELAGDPTFYNAVLSLKAEEADRVARQLGYN